MPPKVVNGPYRGAADNSAFIDTPDDLIPLSGIRNMLLESPGGRFRFHQRPPLKLRFRQQLGGGSHVQAFGVVTRASGVSGYVRVDTPASVLGANLDVTDDANNTYRWSRIDKMFQRNSNGTLGSTGAGTGSPHVIHVLAPDFGLIRSFGRIEDSGTAANVGRVLVSFDTANVAADILTEETDQAPYVEDIAANHQVVMGRQAKWHPNAGVEDDDDEHTLIFTSLISPYYNAGARDGALYTCVTAVNVDTGAILWRTVLKDRDPAGAIPTTPKHTVSVCLLVDTDYTYVAAGMYVHVLNTDTGEYLKRYNVDGWAQEIDSLILCNGLPTAYHGYSGAYAGSVKFKTLRVVFKGSNANNTTGSFSIRDSLTGTGPLPGTDDERFVQAISQWRSGIAEYSVIGDPTAPLERRSIFDNLFGDQNQSPLVSENFGGTNHLTLRFSSMLDRNPRGGHSYAACGGPDPVAAISGTIPPGPAVLANRPIYVGITNRGYGVSSATPGELTNATFGTEANWAWPNSAASPTSIVRFDGDFDKAWEIDTQTALNLYNPIPTSAVAWYNDLPQSIGVVGPEATIMAMVCDSAGNLYAAGKRNAIASNPLLGHNVFKIGPDGRYRCPPYNAGGVIYQHCIAIDPTDNNIIICGERNNDWFRDGVASGVNAFLWKLSAADLEPIAYVNMSMSATVYSGVHSAFGVDVDRIGRIAYATTPGV